ncbi:MAG: ATP synthase F0 subunit B [Treponema sp.]|jgi:F-type H+-transporting ATPase subunit b|nr:ATP synthase F0 subunit B [Treponema sp.]
MIEPSIATFLITLINIGVLFFVLRAVLFKPVTQFMENRTNKIQHTIEEAEKDKAQAKVLVQQYEDQLKNAKGEGDAIIQRARETAQEQVVELLAAGKAEAAALIAHARQQAEVERQAAVALFKAEAATLVISASSRLLQRELNREDSRRFAGLLLQELGKD